MNTKWGEVILNHIVLTGNSKNCYTNLKDPHDWVRSTIPTKAFSILKPSYRPVDRHIVYRKILGDFSHRVSIRIIGFRHRLVGMLDLIPEFHSLVIYCLFKWSANQCSFYSSC